MDFVKGSLPVVMSILDGAESKYIDQRIVDWFTVLTCKYSESYGKNGHVPEAIQSARLAIENALMKTDDSVDECELNNSHNSEYQIGLWESTILLPDSKPHAGLCTVSDELSDALLNNDLVAKPKRPTEEIIDGIDYIYKPNIKRLKRMTVYKKRI